MDGRRAGKTCSIKIDCGTETGFTEGVEFVLLERRVSIVRSAAKKGSRHYLPVVTDVMKRDPGLHNFRLLPCRSRRGHQAGETNRQKQEGAVFSHTRQTSC